MIKLSRFLENNELSEYEKKIYIEEHILVENIFNDYINDFTIADDSEKIENIIKFYNLFTYDTDNEIGKFIRKKIYDFYIDHINELIINRKDSIIYLLLDLFYCDSQLFPNKNNNTEFLDKSYPILLLSTEDYSSLISVASIRLISIIGSENNLYYLQKYVRDMPDGIYIDEVKEELENLI
ncbi:hypothetical protein [Epilithonimonas hungarica]|uniref:Uncharacterized protein n=1 Tax=Epilithonimonas hungarica TaxID=454006 RepID=A0A1G7TMT9_9FLAO|nr:hypothetical protein [Epilithonimonas hungarica]SDG36663.1 hypothetical protein SAMN05421825_3169 [Epilithonimonas hungarica]